MILSFAFLGGGTYLEHSCLFIRFVSDEISNGTLGCDGLAAIIVYTSGYNPS